jgi:hypothetical protein
MSNRLFVPRNMKTGFGNVQLEIRLELDEKGLLRTSISKPIPSIQVIGLLLDAMQGQMQIIRQQSSMIVNPDKEVQSESEPKVEKPNGSSGEA